MEKERKDPNQGGEKADSFGPQGKEQHDLSDEVEGRIKCLQQLGLENLGFASELFL